MSSAPGRFPLRTIGWEGRSKEWYATPDGARYSAANEAQSIASKKAMDSYQAVYDAENGWREAMLAARRADEASDDAWARTGT